jgi:hypothetical protein
MLNVRYSSDALAQPVAADSDHSKCSIHHSTFPMLISRQTIMNNAPVLKNRKEHPDNESIDVKQAEVRVEVEQAPVPD